MRLSFTCGSVLLCVTVLVFAAAVTHEFVLWDDNANIYENGALRAPGFAGVARFWTRPYKQLYIPVTYTVWTGLTKLAQGANGLDPGVFHAANLLVHLANVLLVHRIVQLLLRGRTELSRTRCAWAAATGAALFAWHPLQVEAVAWATGMKDLLCACFSFSALLLWLGFASPTAADRTGAGGRLRHAALAAGATLCFALALLAKPVAVVVPALAWCLVWTGRRRLADGVLLAWLAISLVFVILTRRVQDVASVTFIPPLRMRPFIAGDALAFYLRKLFVPVRLCIDYGRAPRLLQNHRLLYVTWLAPGAAAALAALPRARNTGIHLALLLFVIPLVPVLGFVPFLFQEYSTVADRFVYPAMLGPAVLAALLSSRLRSRHAGALAGFALVTLAALSFRQVRTWRDDFTLFSHALEVNPGSFVSQYNLGRARERRGELGKAADRYEESIAIRADLTPAIIQLGSVKRRLGRQAEARALFSQAVALEPANARARNNYGVALASSGKLTEALVHFSAAHMLRPHDAQTHYNLGMTLEQLGRRPEALVHYSQALALNPADRDTRAALRRLAHSQAGMTKSE